MKGVSVSLELFVDLNKDEFLKLKENSLIGIFRVYGVGENSNTKRDISLEIA